MCAESGITETQRRLVEVSDQETLIKTVRAKANDYAARHQRALEAVAAGHTSGGAKGDLPPLVLPYYPFACFWKVVSTGLRTE